jgi:hypothetical protein
MYLIGCLDGSERRRRYPFCYFEVTGPNGQLVEREFRVRCGNLNTLTWVDFVALPAGGTLNPCERIDRYGFFSAGPYPQYFDVPGKYRVQFVYSTRYDDIRGFGGDNDWGDVENDELMIALFDRVPKVEVRSNVFEVTVLAPGK